MKTYDLYGGRVKLSFYEEGHKYQVTINGHTSTPVGATTILRVLNKPALMLWPMYEYDKYVREFVSNEVPVDEAMLNEALKVYTVKSDKGKGTGSEVHEAIEQFLLGNGPSKPLSKEAEKAINSFLKWWNSQEMKVLATEQPVYSKHYGYAGTFDALLEIDGKIVLCDIKTSNISRTAPLGIYAENFLQLGGYSLAWKEQTASQPTIDDLMVINAGKTGKLSTLRASEVGLSVAQCEDGFIGCVKLHNLMKELSDKLKEVQSVYQSNEV